MDSELSSPGPRTFQGIMRTPCDKNFPWMFEIFFLLSLACSLIFFAFTWCELALTSGDQKFIFIITSLTTYIVIQQPGAQLHT